MENSNAKKRQPRQDRVTLKTEVQERLAGWRVQLAKHYPEMKVSNADLVHHCVLSLPGELGSTELKKIRTECFDEIQFAKWALREVKEAKKRGQSLSLAEVLNRSRGAKVERRAPKKKSLAEGAPAETAQPITT